MEPYIKLKDGNIMKRLLPLFLSLILCFTFAGCSEANESTPPDSSPSAAITQTETESTAPPSEEPEASTPSAEPSTAPPATTEPPSENIDDTAVLPADSTFSIHYIDVGQADAALVECDGHYMLIDGGNKADSNVMQNRNNFGTVVLNPCFQIITLCGYRPGFFCQPLVFAKAITQSFYEIIPVCIVGIVPFKHRLNFFIFCLNLCIDLSKLVLCCKLFFMQIGVSFAVDAQL